MNKRTYKIFTAFTFFYLFLNFLSIGQNIEDDLIEMNKKLNALKAFDTSVDMKVFKKETDNTPTFHSIGRSAKLNDKFFLNVLGRKTIVNNEVMLVIDDKQKLMMYTKISKEQMELMTRPLQLNFDSIIKTRKWNAKCLVNNETEKRIQIRNASDEIKTITISYDPKTYVLKEIMYLYTDETAKKSGSAKILVAYLNFNTSCNQSELFDQSKYIAKKGDGFVTKNAYKNYRLISPKDYSNK